MGGELPWSPGQEESWQYSLVSMFPLESTEVAHHGVESPSILVQRSLSLPW